MADESEQQFGQPAVEAAQGFYQMPEAPPAKSEEVEAVEALEKWSQNREQEVAAKPIIDRAYQHIDGEHAGEPYDPHASVPLDRAAKDLAETREAEAAIAEVERDLELANQIDEARGLRPDLQPAAEQQTQPEAQQQQPGPQQPTDGVDPGLRAALQNPAVLSMLEQHHLENVARVEAAETAASAKADYAVNQAAAYAQNNAALALAAIIARPELQGVPPGQYAGALQALKVSNPAAYADIERQITNTQAVIQQATQAQQQQQQRHAVAFHEWGKANDDAFERSMANEHPETVKAIRQTAMAMMREAGLSDAQLAHEWNSNALLRSAQGQALLADAARWRMAKAGIKPAPKALAPVQRPGSSLDRPAASERNHFELENRYRGPLSAKQAAELVIGRRARSR